MRFVNSIPLLTRSSTRNYRNPVGISLANFTPKKREKGLDNCCVDSHICLTYDAIAYE